MLHRLTDRQAHKRLTFPQGNALPAAMVSRFLVGFFLIIALSVFQKTPLAEDTRALPPSPTWHSEPGSLASGSMPTDESHPLAESNRQINSLVDRPIQSLGTKRWIRSTSQPEATIEAGGRRDPTFGLPPSTVWSADNRRPGLQKATASTGSASAEPRAPVCGDQLIAAWQEKQTRAGDESPSDLPPFLDIGDRVLWGSVARGRGGEILAFGGQDQDSDDGRPYTCLKRNGVWRSLREDLDGRDPASGPRKTILGLVKASQGLAARYRHAYLQDIGARECAALRERTAVLTRDAETLAGRLSEFSVPGDAYWNRQGAVALERFRDGLRAIDKIGCPSPRAVARLRTARIAWERASDALATEPPARALGSLTFEPQSGLYVLFGGDHFGYLMNDTWVFDPTESVWRNRHPGPAPSPRANARIEPAEPGRVRVSGGYVYTSAVGYMSKQYAALDESWIYDVRRDTWIGSGAASGAPADQRTYRRGPFDPAFFLDAPPPSRSTVADKLDDLPANTWVDMDPPRRPRLNRDWGIIVIDPRRDLLLRWSGGHSAHGGTDVLHYHLSTNRWELPIAVEFPLGQLYANTSYPEGVNFNGRPWMTAHSYQTYGLDPGSGMMVFTGRQRLFHVYDPDLGDWVGRGPKPPGMIYRGSHYNLMLTRAGDALYCWTGPPRSSHGELFRYLPENLAWTRVPLSGTPIPASVVDNATLSYDSKRQRLLLFRRPYYGKGNYYDGEIHAVDLATRTNRPLNPRYRNAAAAIPYIGRVAFDSRQDLFVFGSTLPPDENGIRRTPAYDPQANRWVSLRLMGENLIGKKGGDPSVGLVYDARRGLFWTVDANSRVRVLRLDRTTADERPLAAP